MYIASRRGHFRAVIAMFIGLYFSIAIALQLQYGIELQQALLLHVFVIIMTSILSSTKAAFAMTGLISVAHGIVFYLHDNGISTPDLTWKTAELIGKSDVIVFTITFGVIAVVTWLSNREIERSLHRARSSEAELQQERDQLEVRVQQRTTQLEKVQQERIEQLRHFADFGKRASGIIHDIQTPLTALTLNMDSLTKHIDSPDKVGDDIMAVQQSVDSAQSNMHRIEQLLQATTKQIKTESSSITFTIADEVNEAALVLNHQAKQMGVTISSNIDDDITLTGHQLRFSQAITNLIGNAVDAFSSMNQLPENPTVHVQGKLLSTSAKPTVKLTITDNANGIPGDQLQKIFSAFYTTKRDAGGTGLGLTIVKEVIERDFGGTITVDSVVGSGTTFTLTLPSTHDISTPHHSRTSVPSSKWRWFIHESIGPYCSTSPRHHHDHSGYIPVGSYSGHSR